MMKFNRFMLHPFQEDGVNIAIQFGRNAKPGNRLLLCSPTGSGKSIVLLKIQELLGNWWIVAPRIEIIVGLLDKIGIDGVQNFSESKIVSLAHEYKITTPVRLKNVLMYGEKEYDIDGLLIDEGHHHNASTYQQIDFLLAKRPSIAITATPFRGTPKGTQQFLDTWGTPNWLITYPQAVQSNIITMPSVKTLPLVDDDKIEISNGEFVIEQVQSEYKTHLAYIADYCRQFYSAGRWDKPTMFTCPGHEMCNMVLMHLEKAGLPAVAVTDKTPSKMRQRFFKDVIDRTFALVQINVISEGVDLPIRRGIDLACMQSPVKWLQQFGRLTRPGGESEYICTNRNFLRHCYLLEGCIPLQSIIEAQAGFKVSARGGSRVLGLETVGRFKPEEVPLASGVCGLLYRVQCTEDNKTVHYAAVVHPGLIQPLWCTRKDTIVGYDDATGTTEMSYGKWTMCDPPSVLDGFASPAKKQMTDKQKAWWKKSAARHGLNAEHVPTTKSFAILPILNDLRLKLN